MRVDFPFRRAHSRGVGEDSVTFCVVVTTIDSEAGATALARMALAAKLAACVQIAPIRSLYEWNGELRDEAELLVQMKARVADYDALAAAIRAAHSYEVPEILRLDIAAGDAAYLDWAARATARGRE
jgi:periplasmic divalent cation tolerance protein